MSSSLRAWRFRTLLPLLAVVLAPAVAAGEDLSLANWAAPPFWLPASPAPDPVPDSAVVPGTRERLAPDALPSGPLPFFAISPCRVVDTRSGGGPYGRPALAPYVPRSFDIPAGPCAGIPADAGAFSLNFTVIGNAGVYEDAFLTTWPTGTPMPTVSTLNFNGVHLANNAAVVPAGPAGSIDVLVSVGAHLILDINGYYAPVPAVTSLNTLTGAVTLAEGSNVTITPSGQTLTIAASGSGSLPSGAADQTLRHDGSGWVASGLLLNTGTLVAVGGDLNVAGNISLPATSVTSGQVLVNASRFLHRFGSQNTFLGEAAGNVTLTGNSNTGVGYYALSAVTSGTDNTGVGLHALAALTTGTYNSAFGRGTLLSNTVGSDNTAVGRGALTNNTTASRNTALGAMALQVQSHSNGGVAWNSENTAVGYQALQNNQPSSSANGSQNTAVGANSLISNTTGSRNAAIGHGALYSNTIGDENAAVGVAALFANSTANRNTAVGYGALFTQSFSNGGTAWDSENTAVGYEALQANQPASTADGYQNTAVGAHALRSNTTGYMNVAIGHGALGTNTSGDSNVAVGRGALHYSTTSNGNTAVGDLALNVNTNGSGNTAVGAGALEHQGGGLYETESTAVGYHALHANVDGIYNTAVGYWALAQNTTGGRNVALGWGALDASTGSYNTGVGIGAGSRLESGDDNVYVASDLPLGSTSENSTIRIGDAQTRAFLAGVYGVAVSGGTAVYVNSDGQLGTVTSSRRYKRDIAEIGDRSEALRRLRPVAFRYTEDRDPSGAQQYGLIAEEVEGVAPELVVHGRDGRPETVKYELVNALLLDEVLRQRKEIDELRETVRRLVDERRAGR